MESRRECLLRPGNATVRGAVERRFPIACGPRVYDSDPLAPQGSATDRWAIGPEFASDRGHSSNSRMVQAHGNRRHFPSADRNALKVCGAGRGLEAYAPTLRPCNRVPRRASLNGSSCSVRTYRKIPKTRGQREEAAKKNSSNTGVPCQQPMEHARNHAIFWLRLAIEPRRTFGFAHRCMVGPLDREHVGAGGPASAKEENRRTYVAQGV